MSAQTSAGVARDAKSAVPYLDAEGLAAVVERASVPVLIDFTADRCPPCRAMSPLIDALARELSANVVVAKVDVDQHPQLAARFGILSIPTIVLFRDGQVVDQIIGAVPLERLRERVHALQ